MMKPAYINSAACISAQPTFKQDGFLSDVVAYQSTWLKAIEPDYKSYIDPKLIRRMSHGIKMGVSAAMECLKQTGITQPDAIIAGTAYGVMSDTITFLTRMIEMQEQMLPPTAFIQSTHNTIAAQIALTLNCHNYNNTFVHKGISFECALLDALMLINEGEAGHVLVGGVDEMTDTSFKVLTRLGLYRRGEVSNLTLFNDKAKGTIGGEGSAFFMLSDQPSAQSLAKLVGLTTFYKPDNCNEVSDEITAFLAGHQLSVDDISLVVTGKNGDLKNDEAYEILQQGLFKNTTCANYKHLCGEYPTSTSFALWLAAQVIYHQQVPPVLLAAGGSAAPPKRILIYNRYQNKYNALMLVSAN